MNIQAHHDFYSILLEQRTSNEAEANAFLFGLNGCLDNGGAVWVELNPLNF